GLSQALPPLSVDAYPTTYRRAPVPYAALSIASGRRLFREHCVACHGPGGAGDGPAAATLPRRPADLTARHTSDHTAGDLFWWLTHGLGRGMPAFGQRLTEEERWDLINFVRALGAAEAARRLSPAVDPDQPRLAAPDFAFSVGPGLSGTLKDLRGRRTVLLVIFELPGSRTRLARLAQAYETLQGLGLEILAVPAEPAPGIITRLGTDPPILFPVVTAGAAEIVAAYGLLGRTLTPDGARAAGAAPAHMEFLIDRNGYLRARWIPGQGGPGWVEATALVPQIQRLNREAPAPPPAEHVH
ncbi:MAG TPA: c-type cytochrome, partial [Candidatus Binatia bacterium]|nr:c-type cytochrome [Candidatus Binatia bacterium]